jgi:hypothetical protein
MPYTPPHPLEGTASRPRVRDNHGVDDNDAEDEFPLPPALLGLLLLIAVALAVIFLVAAQVVQTP